MESKAFSLYLTIFVESVFHENNKIHSFFLFHDQDHLQHTEWFTVMCVQQGVWIWKFI